jgi:hypothetical protein
MKALTPPDDALPGFVKDVPIFPALRHPWLISLAVIFGLIVVSSAADLQSSNRATNAMLVITPAAFQTALENFVSYKRTLMRVELVTLESVLGKSAGVDDPEKLKHFLYDEWRNRGVHYALLVGDVDVMPVRYMTLDRVTPAAFDYAFYPSDLYYSDLAKADGSFDDWNARKESFHAGYFGEVRGEKNKEDLINYDQVDYLPDIAVGRWPVSSAEEAGRIAEKTMAYEREVLAGTNQRLRRAAFISVGGWVDSRGVLNRLAEGLTNSWQIEKRFYTNKDSPSVTPQPDHEELRAILNGGAGLVVHAGHGDSDRWEKCLSIPDLARLTNSATLPVVISAGCSTAHFAPLPPYEAYMDVNGHEHAGTDHREVFTAPPPPPAVYQKGRFNPTCLGEQILKRNPTGAVVYIGCDTGSQPCALDLVEGFVSALAHANEPRLGDCWASAIRDYFSRNRLATLKPNKDWYPPSIFFQGMKFMVFGDPSLRLPANHL